MNILQINTADILGGAGIAAYRLHKSLNEMPGFRSELLVGIKVGDDDSVTGITDKKYLYYLNRVFHMAAVRLGWDGMRTLTPNNRLSDSIGRADVIHLHNIHGGFFSLPLILRLVEKKPVVWSLHDMWALTGGCYSSYECTDFLNGCKRCCGDSHSHVFREHVWKKKRDTYQQTDMRLIVPSLFMLKMVRASPLLGGFKAEYIPFGANLKIFRPRDIESSRAAFGIGADTLVIGVRASRDRQKGLHFAIDALERIRADQNIALLTFGEKGLVEQLKGKFEVVELGWVIEPDDMAKAYSAMDIFMMPSTAESFGLMAMEAIACGTVVLAFDGTVLAETLFAPSGGITVPQSDIHALSNMIEELLTNPQKRSVISEKATALAKEHYDIDRHVGKIAMLYRDVTKNKLPRP